MKKTTAIAPANIALIKFWGKKNEELRLPTNSSISINLSELKTTTTVEFLDNLKEDQIEINNIKENHPKNRISRHLDRVRKMAQRNCFAKVVTQNNFSISSGMASSASGFAALSLSAAKAIGLNLSEKDLSILARTGSGSSCRSIPDGFVEWVEGNDSDKSSYAYSLYKSDFWDLAIVIVLVGSEMKKVPSSDGHKLVWTSPFFETRLKNINQKIIDLKKYLHEKDFQNFGEIVEREALEMHAIMFTSNPPLIYWEPATIKIMKFIHELREKGLPVYFTIDAGPQLHLICEKKNLQKLQKELQNIPEIKKIIVNYPSAGARIVDKHLF